jgi:hypothetical protein
MVRAAIEGLAMSGADPPAKNWGQADPAADAEVAVRRRMRKAVFMDSAPCPNDGVTAGGQHARQFVSFNCLFSKEKRSPAMPGQSGEENA